MSTNLFPCNGPQRIFIPTPRLDCTPCDRVIFPRERIPVFDPNNAPATQAADNEGYFPINAVYMAAVACRPTACEDALIFENDGMSRCSFWLNTVFEDGQIPTLPVTVDYVIKQAAAAINNPVKHGSFTISPQTPRVGMIVSVSGPLCTQFEFWARVRLGSPGPVDVRLQFIFDRLGDAYVAYEGALAGGGDLPPP